MKWAFIRPDDITIEQLAAIAQRPIPRDANGKPKPEFSQEFYQALTALAILGTDPVLVEILTEILTQTDVLDMLPIHLANLRAHCGPMPKDLTDSALRILQDTALSEDLLLPSLVIAWLSADTDFIPTVRKVLERTDPESQIAKYACIALRELGDQSDDFARAGRAIGSDVSECRMGPECLDRPWK